MVTYLRFLLLTVTIAIAFVSHDHRKAWANDQTSSGADASDLGAGWRFDLGASIQERVAVSYLSSIPVGRPLPDDRSQLEPTPTVENRLRLGEYLAFRHRTGFFREIKIDVQLDLFSGPFKKTLDDELLSYDPLQPDGNSLFASSHHHLRKLSCDVTTVVGRLSGGRTTNSWGLGILAQNGDDDDPLQFGLKRTGHYVTRLSFATMPAAWFMGDRAVVDAPLTVAFAYDWLVHDDRMSVDDGDSGNNIIATLGWFANDFRLGFFGVRRTQENKDGLETKAWVADIYGMGKFGVGGWQVQLATEWAFVVGETEAFRGYANPDSVDVQQVGGVVRFDVAKDLFSARLEGGYASGDSRPNDDTLHAMTFAADYRVGLVLFPELLRRTTAVAAYNAQDPRFTGEPPVGFDDIPSRGAVTQAMYLNAVFGVRPVANMTVLAGALFARTPEDAVDVYRTNLAGGTPTGPRGAAHQTGLGVELDMAIRYRQPLGAGLALMGQLAGGVLFPGGVFDDADGNAAPAMGVVVGQFAVEGMW